jgi:acyl-CoA thioesterase I
MEMPPNYGPAYTRRFAQTYRDVAERTDSVLLPFLLDGFGDRPELFLADGIHPTAEAQHLILDTVWARLEPMLK